MFPTKVGMNRIQNNALDIVLFSFQLAVEVNKRPHTKTVRGLSFYLLSADTRGSTNLPTRERILLPIKNVSNHVRRIPNNNRHTLLSNRQLPIKRRHRLFLNVIPIHRVTPQHGNLPQPHSNIHTHTRQLAYSARITGCTRHTRLRRAATQTKPTIKPMKRIKQQRQHGLHNLTRILKRHYAASSTASCSPHPRPVGISRPNRILSG
nr:MAG TPA: hypothetical protein [Siphoviridae sp. ctcOR4]